MFGGKKIHPRCAVLQDPQVSVADVLAFLHSVRREGTEPSLKWAFARVFWKIPRHRDSEEVSLITWVFYLNTEIDIDFRSVILVGLVFFVNCNCHKNKLDNFGLDLGSTPHPGCNRGKWSRPLRNVSCPPCEWNTGILHPGGEPKL